ncbi:hypothetical protein N0V82_001915 [Gnomoniopsis sp. IMI 355080]|nr:hypothetical protein N0V82_001915 [Gnomoniopsis sp. IMI 355080]
MDQAYNAHQARRKNRSSSNLNHLSLAPLTTKLPIHDSDMIYSELSIPTSYSTSYMQGKSAPTTPSLLARSPVRPTSTNKKGARSPYGHGAASPSLAKSKSATNLSTRPKSGATTPGGYRRGSRKEFLRDIHTSAAPPARVDSDWLLRAGVLISSETRESKGQSWLVSRASSTSLDRLENDDINEKDIFERERIARENLMSSRHTSRRGSLAFLLADDESPFLSRQGSGHASRSQLVTPGERATMEGYFAGQAIGEDEFIPGPDFVNLNEKLEAAGSEGDMNLDDETAVRKLVNSRHGRSHTWYASVLGWTLFAVQENEDEDDEADGEATTDGEAEDCLSETSGTDRNLELRFASLSEPQSLSPPKSDDAGWKDAAWLLSVASKVAWS